MGRLLLTPAASADHVPGDVRNDLPFRLGLQILFARIRNVCREYRVLYIQQMKRRRHFSSWSECRRRDKSTYPRIVWNFFFSIRSTTGPVSCTRVSRQPVCARRLSFVSTRPIRPRTTVWTTRSERQPQEGLCFFDLGALFFPILLHSIYMTRIKRETRLSHDINDKKQGVIVQCLSDDLT